MNEDLNSENGVNPETPPILQDVGRIGDPGDYLKRLSMSPFRQSGLLADAAPFIEAGRFSEGVRETLRGLAERGIAFKFLPESKERRRGTRVVDGKEYMIFDDTFEKERPAFQLWALLHRNMSLILQRQGLRENENYLRQLFHMDIVYAQAVRCGAMQLRNTSDINSTLSTADYLDLVARSKLRRLRRKLG